MHSRAAPLLEARSLRWRQASEVCGHAVWGRRPTRLHMQKTRHSLFDELARLSVWGVRCSRMSNALIMVCGTILMGIGVLLSLTVVFVFPGALIVFVGLAVIGYALYRMFSPEYEVMRAEKERRKKS